MSYAKVSHLVSLLHDKTTAGNIKWEETASASMFTTSLSSYSVGVSEIETSEEPDYVITIFNEEGRIIEQVSDVDLRDTLDNSYTLMRELYDVARRSAMGVDEALDKILGELDDGFPF